MSQSDSTSPDAKRPHRRIHPHRILFLYTLIFMVGMFASIYETRVGMVASYCFFFSGVASVFSRRLWLFWATAFSAVVLAALLLPMEIKMIIVRPQMMIDPPQILIVHVLILILMPFSVFLSGRALARAKRTGE